MKNLEEVRWGILGCGDVCEVKSGPAFNKVRHSKLVAVMRRDGEKAKEFARRHSVPRHYDDVRQLIEDDEINAIYIATPPAFHEEYTVQAIRAGKPVYIEKPVSTDTASCARMLDESLKQNVKCVVAHYRRELPLFREVRSLIQSGTIGKPTLVLNNTLLAPGEKIKAPGYWRTDPKISGGGLFFDLAPHQLDIFYWLFGAPSHVRGYSMNQKGLYEAPDLTTVEAVFEKNVYLHGLWAFNLPSGQERELCEIIGEKGKVSFSFFSMGYIEITSPEGTERITLGHPENIQLPMIDAAVRYFRGEGPNPCSLEDALITMRMMDATIAP